MKKCIFLSITIITIFILYLIIYRIVFYKEVNIPNIYEPVIEENIVNTIEYNKLMIVAHPDDDIIFGGEHLINDNYMVVCVTCGTNKTREKEFITVMNASNDKYIMLKHTDLVRGYISDWKNEYDDIESEIKEIINEKDWDLIVTHNPNGEYGHKHHKKLNKIVTKNVNDKSKLFYFGKYYEKDTDQNVEKIMSEETYRKKFSLLKLYKSQNLKEGSRHSYMFNHENWISYSDWS